MICISLQAHRYLEYYDKYNGSYGAIQYMYVHICHVSMSSET